MDTPFYKRRKSGKYPPGAPQSKGPTMPDGIETVTHDLILKYDPVKQCVGVVFDNTQFTTWELMLGVLEMGRLFLETQRQMAISQKMQQAAMNQMMQQQQAAQQAAQVAKAIELGRQ
jgi:hypothetical protein